jgi:hypothetical protein
MFFSAGAKKARLPEKPPYATNGSRQIVWIKTFLTPLRSSVHTLAGSGSARYNVLRLFVSPEFDFAEGSLFKPLVGLESKIKRSKKQTINTPSSVLYEIQTEEKATKA